MMPTVSVTSSPYGKAYGQDVTAYTLKNAHGVEATILNFGAILTSLITPDAHGESADIVLGFDKMEHWLVNPPYFGATVGRCANRIAHGKFTLDGEDYSLATNNDPAGLPSHLHGGLQGFDKKLWDADTSITEDAAHVQLTYISPAGEEGYPGELTTLVTYSLNNQNELSWHVQARTDAPTIVNIVNHTYWNLSGDLTQSIGDHILQIESDSFLPSNAGLIPTGKPAPIEYTPLDFIAPKPMGQEIDAEYQPLTDAKGYDQAFILKNDGTVQKASTVVHPDSGRCLEVFTDQPALHFYTGNYIENQPVGKNGDIYSERCGFALETENWPNAINNPEAPSPILRPGETYTHTLICKLSW